MKTLLTIFFLLIANFDWGIFNKILGYQVGDYARDFKLKNVDGKMVSMADFKDAKGFIIAFTCNTCPYAILYESRIINLHNRYISKGYQLIAINPNDAGIQPGDSYENMQRRARDKNYPFPYLVDETQEIARDYGATNTPHLYILKRTGDKYQVMYIGTIDNNPKNPGEATRHYVDEAMSQILDGQPVSEPVTKAIGCGIKWKI